MGVAIRGTRLRPWAGALAATVAAGCYTYTPLGVAVPAPGAEISLVLTDQGRVAAGGVLGPSADRVEGPLMGASDSAYLLRVTRVTDIRGIQSRWSAESATMCICGEAICPVRVRRPARSRDGAIQAGTTRAAAQRFRL